MRKIQLFIYNAVVVSALWACAKEAVDPSSVAYDKNDAEIRDYVAKNDTLKGGQTTNGGLYYKITRPNPTGKQATVGEELEFSYKATNLRTGLFVDSSAVAFPYYYPLGIGTVLPGLEQGLSLMREGEKAIFLIPSYLAYNDKPLPSLEAYSVVRFDVTLTKSRSEDQQINEYITRNKLVVTETTASGLRFIRTQTNAMSAAPTGIVPTAGQTLTIKYLGKQLRTATAFDSTRAAETADFVLGQGKNVKGFEEGLSKLRVGEKATILFPSSLGYGTQGFVVGRTYAITPYAPLRFDLELVSAK